MKRFALLVLFALAAAGLSFADVVNYDTAQSYFACTNSATLTGCGQKQVTIGSGTDAVVLTYLSTTVTNLNAMPSSITNFGRLLVSCLNGGTACTSQSLGAGVLNFSIVINQTGPEALTGAIAAASITGLFSGTSGFGFATWSQGSSSDLIGQNFDVKYAILLNNNRLGLVVPVSSNCSDPCPVSGPAGETSIQGQISVSSMPEPAVSLMLAGGLLALGVMRRRK